VAANHLTATDYACFLIPSLQFIQINLIGVLNGTDILLLLAFIYFAAQGKITVKSPRARRVLLFGLLWLASQVATDIYRHTIFADYARGWSNIGLTLINFCVMCTLIYGKPQRLVLFGWGIAAAGILRFFINPADVQLDYPWKFGLSYPVTMGVVIWASRKDARKDAPAILLAAIGVINFVLGARNAGGTCFAAALYLSLTPVVRRMTAGGAKLKKRVIIAALSMFFVGGGAIFWAYQKAVESGYLGAEAQQKYLEQSSGKYGVLLGGRVELLASIPAIIDSPILGHGSWARDPTYIIAMREALLLLNYKGALDMSPDELTEGLIPSHSFLLSAWVYAGLLGAVFWAWLWVMIIRSLARVYPPAAHMLPMFAYFGFLLIWDILFSPFGLDRRAQVPYYLMVIITYYDMAARSAAQAAATRAKGMLKPALDPGL
jgi:hypothetical protein